MKKSIYFLLLLTAIITACVSGEKPKKEISKELKKQTEKIEQATQESVELIHNSESKFKATQSKIDSLLNDI
ncbi:hypothetical protein [Tenacibaculum sp. UWU-22]|uniref:hypothetical protein n=1 Tax=Tenacibaculum sp. UWU-22 TaxID=3234187 RepID=UPI0034DADCEC